MGAPEKFRWGFAPDPTEEWAHETEQKHHASAVARAATAHPMPAADAFLFLHGPARQELLNRGQAEPEVARSVDRRIEPPIRRSTAPSSVSPAAAPEGSVYAPGR